MIKQNELTKFLFVTAGAIVIDFAVYMIWCSFANVTLSKFISEIVACTYQYFLNKNYTFEYGKNKNSILLVSRYILSQAGNIASNILTNYISFELSGNKIIAFISATVVATVVNYLLQKFIVFKK